ncbi:MAG TPA: ABC transporter permease [Candidatus Acidoferrales bacterium]|jgi:ABC-type multidrug transport system permease subunit|nr:ABC transporter permease [Candidatus Acidoferrales bacterium]
MATITAPSMLSRDRVALTPRTSALAALATLARRRFSLTARTPREIIVPLMTPVLFAVVIAPALRDAVGGSRNGVDYMSFVALATVGLLIPLNTIFAGLSVLVDRASGAQRELLAAPIRRALLVGGNLIVAITITGLQLTVLIVLAAVRGAQFHVTPSGMAWFVATALLFTIGMYGIAETLASRIKHQEEYVGFTPAIAIVPWFFAGSLFPISVLPGFLTVFAKFLPLTHALGVVRYGLLGAQGSGLHDIWGMTNATTMAALSLGVVAVFAAASMTLAVRSFTRSAVR